MTRKTPFFITASLLVATLALFLPDLDLEPAAEEPVEGVTLARRPALRADVRAGASHASSSEEVQP